MDLRFNRVSSFYPNLTVELRNVRLSIGSSLIPNSSATLIDLCLKLLPILLLHPTTKH